MRFTINTNRFLKAINLVNRSISTTTPLPSLAGILMKAEAGALSLTASDFNISIRTTVTSDEVNVEEEGTININARYLHDIIQNLSGLTTTVTLIDGTLLEIVSDNSVFKINGMPAIDYPNISFECSGKPFTLKTKIVEDIISNVAFACSTDETRPALTGVNLKANGKELDCVGTDSRRLSLKKLELEEEENFDIVVPVKYLTKIKDSIADQDECEVKIDSQRITFSFANTIISARLIEDSFPSISHLFPNTFKQQAKLNSRELVSAITRSSIMKYEGKDTIKMSFKNDKLELTAISQEVGTSYDVLTPISYEGSDLVIGCSGKHLSDAVRVMGNKETLLCFNGEAHPIIIKNPEDDSLIQLISPTRVYF